MADVPGPDDVLLLGYEAIRENWLACVAENERLSTELADARTAIRWLRDGVEPIDVVAVSEAIAAARRATSEGDASDD